MAQVRYVVLSDLHLGAAYSLLTDTSADGHARPHERAPVLEALADGLEHTLRAMAHDRPPTLVLLGDVFDLAFSSAADTMAAFERLIEAFFRRPVPLFDRRIVYVPGNHDHRHWQVIRDRIDEANLASTPPPGMPEPFVVTPLAGDDLPVCDVVTALARRATGDESVVVEAAYPNLAHRHGDRWVVLHHGHYAEGTYRAVSTLLTTLQGAVPVTDLRTIELLDGPWIDFFWSTFGGQGPLGTDVFDLYETMQDPAATHVAVRRMTSRLLQVLGGKVPIDGDATITSHGVSVTVRGLVEGVLDMTLAKLAQSERAGGATVLSPDGVEGVRRYLGQSVRPELVANGWEPAQPTAFVFGHTHKPFQDQLLVPGFDLPVRTYNTGGWVLDQPSLSPTQGAAAVLVDDDANVASLRLYNNPVPHLPEVAAKGCSGVDERHNPLLADLTAAVDAAGPQWAAFTEAVAGAIDLRSRFVRRMFFDPDARAATADRAPAMAPVTTGGPS